MARLLTGFSRFSTQRNDVLRTLAGPYLVLGARINPTLPDGSRTGTHLLFSPAKEEIITVPDLIVPKELMCSNLVGISGRWGICSLKHSDGSLLMNNFLNPSKMIPLPRFTTLPGNQTQAVRDVAMSSTSPLEEEQEEDCVVAVRFLGSQISLCRPNRDLSWTNLELPFACLDNSNLVYSKRDQCFYFPTPGSNWLCSLDLNFKEGDSPELRQRQLQFRDLPELSMSEYQMLDSCSRAEHWVESSSGESFLVKWYSYVSPWEQRDPIFMVFSEVETTEGKLMCYTEDIGDLCIFLSKSQPFCVEASSYPGLEPNSIYVMTPANFGVYNLATKTIREFEPPRAGPVEITFPPFWIPPFSI